MQPQSIYERIELLIKNKGITKKSFCEQLKISTGNFGDWKRGKSTPGTHKLIEIAAYFDVSLDWLLIGKERQAEMIKEQSSPYFFELMGQLNCQEDVLNENEKEFIKEYIEFTAYRKSKQQEE
ncbi:helix-turn-helix domain-containing protein [Paenibacillus shenyangensis]|uniref:helix-turn-helix domain-containing protein n=1 Tax=Paenibacillus sp. A9 TaxID=1284352 RepID=UPI000379ACEC|nr:helix-turn-helix domain-containing protein [Paenibacillus sp. A9]